MAGLVSNLIEVLKGQMDLYQQIIALSVDKKEYIIKNDIENLRRIVSKENSLVPKALRGDKEREKIMKDICMVLNKKEEDMTLSYLVVLMENQPEHEELKSVVEQIKHYAEEMKDVNESNKALVQNALEFIDYNINVIHSTFSEAPAGYNPTLEENMGQKGFLDNKG